MSAPAVDLELGAVSSPLHAAIEALRVALEAGPGDVGEPLRLGPVAALDAIGRAFAMTGFERDLLLLCAAAQLDGTVAARCRELTGRAEPCFALASRVLAEPHWSALHPVRPLRWWRMVEAEGEGLSPWTPLRIDPRLLHQLLGMPHVDERLEGILRPLSPSPWPLASLQAQGRAVAARLDHDGGEPPVVTLEGGELSWRYAVAHEAARSLGLDAFVMRSLDLPTEPGARLSLARLWSREVMLSGGLLVIDADEGGDPAALEHLLACLDVPAVVLGRCARVAKLRPVYAVEIEAPTTREVLCAWKVEAEGAPPWPPGVEEVLADYRLGLRQLEAVHRELRGAAPHEYEPTARSACRAQVRGGLDGLAQSLPTLASWDDLVLPAPQREQLAQIIEHVRHRHRVYETWGLAERGRRGLGICALFHGASGTGKTTAAEVIASSLQLSLYRVDLGQVVSKYIGETEKKLEQIFSAADGAGVVLLFDEADALFGRRTEVRDSHDRYANIEVSYLLQRIETYRGLALLTSNDKAALDRAFTRRLRFSVEFPFPDRDARAEIWRRCLPPRIPTEVLDFGALAELALSGGGIRNVVLAASIRSAAEERPLSMAHLGLAARLELAKSGTPTPESLLRRWA